MSTSAGRSKNTSSTAASGTAKNGNMKRKIADVSIQDPVPKRMRTVEYLELGSDYLELESDSGDSDSSLELLVLPVRRRPVSPPAPTPMPEEIATLFSQVDADFSTVVAALQPRYNALHEEETTAFIEEKAKRVELGAARKYLKMFESKVERQFGPIQVQRLCRESIDSTVGGEFGELEGTITSLQHSLRTKRRPLQERVNAASAALNIAISRRMLAEITKSGFMLSITHELGVNVDAALGRGLPDDHPGSPGPNPHTRG